MPFSDELTSPLQRARLLQDVNAPLYGGFDKKIHNFEGDGYETPAELARQIETVRNDSQQCGIS